MRQRMRRLAALVIVLLGLLTLSISTGCSESPSPRRAELTQQGRQETVEAVEAAKTTGGEPARATAVESVSYYWSSFTHGVADGAQTFWDFLGEVGRWALNIGLTGLILAVVLKSDDGGEASKEAIVFLLVGVGLAWLFSLPTLATIAGGLVLGLLAAIFGDKLPWLLKWVALAFTLVAILVKTSW